MVLKYDFGKSESYPFRQHLSKSLKVSDIKCMCNISSKGSEVAKKGNAQVKRKYLKAVLKHSTQVNVLNSLTKKKKEK